MKQVVTLSLILLVLIQCSMKLAIVVSYQINKDYIVANFCVNKSKPEMKCDGKCYLAKQMKSEEDSEQQLPSILKKIGDINFFFSSATSFSFSRISHTVSLISHSAYLLKFCATPLASIFQPPQ